MVLIRDWRVVQWSMGIFDTKPMAVVMNIAALIVTLGIFTLVWDYLRPNPIRSVEIVSITPADRIIDRSKNGDLVIQRRVCASRPTSVRLIRTWIDAGAGVTPTLDDWASLAEGCHVRVPIHVVPPPSLNEGIHRYRALLETCSPLKLSCHQYHVEDVEVMIVGRQPIGNLSPHLQRF